MFYFLTNDGRVPSQEFVKKIGERLGPNIEFQYQRGTFLNDVPSLLNDIKERELSDWEMVLIIPTNDEDKKVDAYLTNSLETKKAILQRLIEKKDSTLFAGELLVDLFI